MLLISRVRKENSVNAPNEVDIKGKNGKSHIFYSVFLA